MNDEKLATLLEWHKDEVKHCVRQLAYENRTAKERSRYDRRRLRHEQTIDALSELIRWRAANPTKEGQEP